MIDNIHSVRERLCELSDERYREFSSSLVPNEQNMMGVRLPALRKLAGEIAKSGFWREYLKSDTNGVFEEKMLHGMVIGAVKIDFDEKTELIREFLPLIDSWSVCDSFCSSLKDMKKDRERFFGLLEPYFEDENEFTVRFAVVALLSLFNEREWLERNFEMLEKVSHDGYYVKMAVGWAVSVFFVTDSALTKRFIESGKCDNESLIMAMNKIRDSLRVGKEDKEYAARTRKKLREASQN